MRQAFTLDVHDNASVDPGDSIRNVSIRNSGLCVVTQNVNNIYSHSMKGSTGMDGLLVVSRRAFLTFS